jgi:hypothetical protein
MDRPRILLIGMIGVGFVGWNDQNLTGAHGHSASVDFKPALALGAENQNAFIEPIRALNAMTPRFGKPAETDDMQADAEGMATHIPKHANRREMHDPVRVSLWTRFHV